MADEPDRRPLMSAEDVSAWLKEHRGRDVQPQNIRRLMWRYGVKEQRGYPPEEVEVIELVGQGKRTGHSEGRGADSSS